MTNGYGDATAEQQQQQQQQQKPFQQQRLSRNDSIDGINEDGSQSQNGVDSRKKLIMDYLAAQEDSLSPHEIARTIESKGDYCF